MIRPDRRTVCVVALSLALLVGAAAPGLTVDEFAAGL